MKITSTASACAFGLLVFASVSAGESIQVPVSSPDTLAYHAASNWFWGLSQLASLIWPLTLLVTGWGEHMYQFIARVTRQRSVVSLASFVAIFFLLDRLVRLPISYLWDRAYDQTTGSQGQAFIPWVANQLSGWILPIAGLTLLAVLASIVIRKSPNRWWLWASAVAATLVLIFLLAEPFTQNHKPLGSLPLEQRIAALAARAGIPQNAIGIEHCDPASSCPPGRVIGLGPTRLMLLNDALLAQNPESWTLQTVAHEAKHFAKDDNLKALFLLSGLAFAGLWLMSSIGRAVVKCRSVAGSVGAHATSVLLAILLFHILHLVALPPVNAFRQHVELEADRYALELTRDNLTQAQMLASFAIGKGRVSEWSPFFKLFRATHPSDATRIQLSNSYRPWQEGKPLVYERDFVPEKDRK
jgi:STE24 endopeptidase